MSLTVRMCAANKPKLDNKRLMRLKSAFRSQKNKRLNHRIALDKLDTFLELVDDAMDVMNGAEVVKEAQDK